MDQRSGRAHEPNAEKGTVRRYHDSGLNQLRAHFNTFLAAYNFARKLKALKGLTPAEYVAKCWTEQPKRSKQHPNQLFAGLNI